MTAPASIQTPVPLVRVDGLSLSIGSKAILNDVSFDLEPGKVTGLVGESGSGKSLTALSIMQLLPNGSRTQGLIDIDGKNLLEASEAQMCALRGDDIGMVFQEPMTALNPLKTIGDQVAEGIALHTGVSRKNALETAADILRRVGLPPERFPLNRYPHQLSGGQRQRVVIAIACALKPRLLICDEPTTALDVIVQARILHLLRELVDENEMAMLFITHDLGVVAEIADDIVIMRHGMVQEKGPTLPVLRDTTHPYTSQLAEAAHHVPANAGRWRPVGKSALITVSGLTCEYPGRRTGLLTREPPFRAVDAVSFDIKQGEILGLVGESGCGKSTLARTLLGLMRPASGIIKTGDGNLLNSPEQTDRPAIVHLAQAVFQDPYGSFNPRHTAGRIVAEPLFLYASSEEEKRAAVTEALESVGLSADDMAKYPHEFSGGQRQRLAIARAIVNRPGIVIADEPVSALDVSIRAQVLDLIINLRETQKLAWLFISHDLAVVEAICDTVMVMQAGKIVETGTAEKMRKMPSHAYTRELLAAAPDLARALEAPPT